MKPIIVRLRETLVRRRSPETMLRRVQGLERKMATARQELAGWQDLAQRQQETIGELSAQIEMQDMIIAAMQEVLDQRDRDLTDLENKLGEGSVEGDWDA